MVRIDSVDHEPGAWVVGSELRDVRRDGFEALQLEPVIGKAAPMAPGRLQVASAQRLVVSAPGREKLADNAVGDRCGDNIVSSDQLCHPASLPRPSPHPGHAAVMRLGPLRAQTWSAAKGGQHRVGEWWRRVRCRNATERRP